MVAPVLIKTDNGLLFPDNRAVSLSEYRNNISQAERSRDMSFTEVENRLGLWERSL